jgi:competence protein ComFC
MNVIENIKKLGQGFLDLVFPISCLICGKDGLYLCENCKSKLPKLETQQCLVCQKPVPFGKTHPECVSRNSVDGIISALPYKNKAVHEIIRILKYNFVSDLAKPLAELTHDEIKNQNLNDYFSQFTIIPVPLHKRRLNWRGFNQSELLAKELQNKLNSKLDLTLVQRIKYTTPQIDLNLEQRKTNITNAFESKTEIAGQKFLIVDDVVTTGATINEIAKLLKKLGATEVWGITAARG